MFKNKKLLKTIGIASLSLSMILGLGGLNSINANADSSENYDAFLKPYYTKTDNRTKAQDKIIAKQGYDSALIPANHANHNDPEKMNLPYYGNETLDATNYDSSKDSPTNYRALMQQALIDHTTPSKELVKQTNDEAYMTDHDTNTLMDSMTRTNSLLYRNNKHYTSAIGHDTAKYYGYQVYYYPKKDLKNANFYEGGDKDLSFDEGATTGSDKLEFSGKDDINKNFEPNLNYKGDTDSTPKGLAKEVQKKYGYNIPGPKGTYFKNGHPIVKGKYNMSRHARRHTARRARKHARKYIARRRATKKSKISRKRAKKHATKKNNKHAKRSKRANRKHSKARK